VPCSKRDLHVAPAGGRGSGSSNGEAAGIAGD
jgi:hypothetical protein